MSKKVRKVQLMAKKGSDSIPKPQKSSVEQGNIEGSEPFTLVAKSSIEKPARDSKKLAQGSEGSEGSENQFQLSHDGRTVERLRVLKAQREAQQQKESP